MIDDNKKSASATDRPLDITRYVESLLEKDEPIVLKINDRMQVSVQGDECRQLLLELVDRSDTIEKVQQALKSVERGEGIPFDEFVANKKLKYDL